MINKKIYMLLWVAGITVQAFAQPRIEENFNKNWKFFPGDRKGAQETGFYDGDWRKLNLPHDWSIESDFKQEYPATNQGGALPGGIAWYRKNFTVPESSKDKSMAIHFDGIYQNSEVWINGHFLGKRPNGYISFEYDLSPYLNYGDKENQLAVRVNNSEQPNSRWYTGSGIYRNVYLITTNKLAIDTWGIYYYTPEVNTSRAILQHETSIRNPTAALVELRIEVTVSDHRGNEVARESKNIQVQQGGTTLKQQLSVSNPHLWSVKDPYLYTISTKIYRNKELLDEKSNSLGIRYFNFDAQKGFSLNGKKMKILGVCLHHDLGALGAAVNVRAMERQLQLMKDMGANAIRTAHNPPAPEFLDLCDKMGFLVMDEAFDMWNKKKNKFDYHLHFGKWHQRDLEDQIRRDRNHPSVFIWSIGNEIREQFDSTGIRIATELTKMVKKLDHTRPVTSALTETHYSKNFIAQSDVLDVLSFNYKSYDYDSLPGRFKQPLLAGETASALETRGVYDLADTLRLWPASSKDKFVVGGNPDHTATAYDNVAAYWGTSHEKSWKAVKDREFMSGLFVWAGIDYLGEPVPYDFPARSSYYGIVDLAGFPKDVYYMYQSEWTDQAVLHLLPHWNWESGKIVDVWAYYSQADEVELFLNGRSLGTKTKEEETLHAVWKVPFEPGTLEAISKKDGKVVLCKEIHTAGKPYAIQLVADRKKLKADGQDVSFVTANVVDRKGNVVPDAGHLIQFKIEGEGTIAGTDNGYQADLNTLSKPERHAWKGKCLAIVKTNEKSGTIKLTAVAEGLKTEKLKLKSR